MKKNDEENIKSICGGGSFLRLEPFLWLLKGVGLQND